LSGWDIVKEYVLAFRSTAKWQLDEVKRQIGKFPHETFGHLSKNATLALGDKIFFYLNFTAIVGEVDEGERPGVGRSLGQEFELV
jgi:hypothetical protein